MAKLFIKPASEGLNHHSYDPITVCSTDLKRLTCSRIIELVPSDDFNKIHGEAEMQLAPQVFPPYGRLFMRTAAFFVPEHQIFSASEAFHSNMTLYKGRAFKKPNISLYNCLNVRLGTSQYSTLVYTGKESDNPDPESDFPDEKLYDFITIQNNSGELWYNFWKLKEVGYHYYSFFKSLGYDFVTPPYVIGLPLPSGFGNHYDYCMSFINYRRDALPILAYAKVYADYFIPGQFFNGSVLVKFLQSVHDIADMSVGGLPYFNAATGYVSDAAVDMIYRSCLTPVMQDMYTSAWNSPNSPLGVVPSDYSSAANSGIIGPNLVQLQTGSDEIVNADTAVRLKNHNNADLTSITSFGNMILNAFTRFVIRNNLSGTRPVQRTLARFGIKPSDSTSHFVSKLFESSEKIKFHPVLSNSSNVVNGSTTVGEGLGDIAGFSKSAFSFDFQYKSSDYGFIIIVHWLQIKPMLLHGQDPMTMRLQPFDCFTPEYDGQAFRAIPKCEISIQKEKRNQVSAQSDPAPDESIYGFMGIYDDYRELRDSVFGDFLNGFAKDFLFARDYTKFRSTNDGVLKPQSDSVQYMSGGGFTQPFQMSDTIGDRFWLGIQFDIEAERPIKTKSDALMLNGSGDTEIVSNGTLNS